MRIMTSIEHAIVIGAVGPKRSGIPLVRIWTKGFLNFSEVMANIGSGRGKRLSSGDENSLEVNIYSMMRFTTFSLFVLVAMIRTVFRQNAVFKNMC